MERNPNPQADVPPSDVVSPGKHHGCMTPNNSESLKFHLEFLPFEGRVTRGEYLWGRWIDRRRGLVAAHNNAHEVPLAVNDTVRVVRSPAGTLEMVEIVRVAESIVTWTWFEPPVTTRQALSVYDGWVHDGLAVHTEGGYGVMATAWREFLDVEKVQHTLSVLPMPGWSLLAMFTPEQRLAEITRKVALGVGGQTGA